MTKTRPSAKPPSPSELARQAKRAAALCHREFDLAGAITAAERAAEWLAEVKRLHRVKLLRLWNPR